MNFKEWFSNNWQDDSIDISTKLKDFTNRVQDWSRVVFRDLNRKKC